MLIRSQDKLQLIPLEIGSISTGYKDLEDSKKIYFYDAGCTTPSSTLGLYSTQEKAIKVLDLIQEAYENSCTVEAHIPGCTPYMAIHSTVFKMPKDDEVPDLQEED